MLQLPGWGLSPCRIAFPGPRTDLPVALLIPLKPTKLGSQDCGEGLIRKRLSTAKPCGGTNLSAAFRARPSHRDLLLAQVHSDLLRFAQIRLVSSEFYRFTHSHPDSHKLFQIHADCCSPTQNRTLSFRFTQTNLDSPHPLQILSISFRFTQSRLDPLQSTLSQSDSDRFP